MDKHSHIYKIRRLKFTPNNEFKIGNECECDLTFQKHFPIIL